MDAVIVQVNAATRLEVWTAEIVSIKFPTQFFFAVSSIKIRACKF